MAKKAPVTPEVKSPAKPRKPRVKKPADAVDTDVMAERIDAVFSFNEFVASHGSVVRKRVNASTGEIEVYSIEPPPKPPKPETTLGNLDAWHTSILWEIIPVALAAIIGICAGIWIAGGISVRPDAPVFNDSLSQSHEADRVSQVRILREYAGKTFADEPTAQKWLNDQRIEARKADWIPYTDELGAAADSGVDAVKALADKLEGKR